MQQYTTTYTIKTLAARLGTTLDAVLRTCQRLKLGIKGAASEIAPDKLKVVLEHYSTPHHRRPSDVVLIASELLKSIEKPEEKESEVVTGESAGTDIKKPLRRKYKFTFRERVILPAPMLCLVAFLEQEVEPLFVTVSPASMALEQPITTTAPDRKGITSPITKATTEETKGFLESRGFLFVVLMSAIVWQSEHTATVVMELTKLKATWATFLSGFLFAFAVQFTALLMTLRADKRAYIAIYSFIDFVINMIYYKPWANDADKTTWVACIVISGLIAFTIYSYSEIFTKKNEATGENKTALA